MSILFDNAGRQISLAQGSVKIGRGPDNNIVVSDNSVSRHHATIYVASNEAVLRDHGSSNGTFVRGQRINRDQVLNDGEQIKFGSVPFTFHDGSPQPYRDPTVPTSQIARSRPQMPGLATAGRSPAAAKPRSFEAPQARGGTSCPNCGRSFGGGRCCQFCKQVEGLPTGITIASAATRLFALLMEYIVAGIVVGLLFIAASATGANPGDAVAGLASVIALALGATFFVCSIVMFSRGQSPGKYFVGLRVINVQESQAAGFATMFLREFIAKPLIMILSSVTLGIVNFWLVWDRDTQELWDKVVNTIVVSDPLGRTRRP